MDTAGAVRLAWGIGTRHFGASGVLEIVGNLSEVILDLNIRLICIVDGSTGEVGRIRILSRNESLVLLHILRNLYMDGE